MTRRDIAFLACRIIALWLFVQVAMNLSLVFAVFAVLIARMFGDVPGSSQVGMLLAGLPSVVLFVAGALLWWKSAWFARRMVRDDLDDEAGGAVAVDARTVMTVACVAVGLFLAVPAVRELSQFVLQAVYYSDRSLYPEGAGINASTDIVPVVIQALLAAWLIFGARGIVRFLHALRCPNLRPPADATDEQDASADESRREGD